MWYIFLFFFLLLSCMWIMHIPKLYNIRNRFNLSVSIRQYCQGRLRWGSLLCLFIISWDGAGVYHLYSSSSLIRSLFLSFFNKLFCHLFPLSKQTLPFKVISCQKQKLPWYSDKSTCSPFWMQSQSFTSDILPIRKVITTWSLSFDLLLTLTLFLTVPW